MSISNSAPTGSPSGVVLEYGLYRDGDNNLDAAEGPVIPQAVAVSKANSNVQITVEDTTSLNGGGLKTYNYVIDHGQINHLRSSPRHDMATRAELANDVSDTLDNSEAVGATQTWIEPVDHGAGDAGGLFTMDPDGSVNHMSEDALAGAISDGEALHARRHPEDANRRIDGVMFHECFELTVGMAATLSKVGVKYLAASPETTIAPGVPTTVAADIARNSTNPQAMANAVVKDVISTKYREHGLTYGPTAAFDVLDISPTKMNEVVDAERAFNVAVLNAIRKDRSVGKRLLADAHQVPGMQRDEPDAVVPWRADRPAIKLYVTIAADPKMDLEVRQAALRAAQAIAATVIAHGETRNAVGFGRNYTDAIGPTTRFPVRYNQIDPLSPELAETACGYAYASGRNAVIQALLLNPGSAATPQNQAAQAA